MLIRFDEPCGKSKNSEFFDSARLYSHSQKNDFNLFGKSKRQQKRCSKVRLERMEENKREGKDESSIKSVES